MDSYSESAAGEVADWDVRVEAPAGSTVLATGTETEPGRFVAEAVRGWAPRSHPCARGSARPGAAGPPWWWAWPPTPPATRWRWPGWPPPPSTAWPPARGEHPHPRLTIGVSPSLTGGIEVPTHIHFGSAARRSSLVHEVGHQWFYGVAGNDQYRDPWLDEALATYAEARFNGRLAAQRARSVPALGRTHLGESWAFWRSHAGSYHQAVYLGGLQALGALADRLGGYDALDCALRRYHHDRAYTVSRPADFFDAVTAQSGVDARGVLGPFGLAMSRRNFPPEIHENLPVVI